MYAWFLRKAFADAGIDARFIKEQTLKQEAPSEADHTIVISAAAYTYMKAIKGYAEKLRQSTAGKLTCYMNIDKLRDGGQYFDHYFTQIEPTSYRHEKHICVGWGVDSSYSYPEQDEKAVFLDSKDLRPQTIKWVEEAYQTYDSTLSKIDMKIYNPVPTYNKSKRLPYPDYQAILRKCHYFLCTQFGDGGLNRLEAAACGALLVVPTRLYRRRTMSLLNHQVWHTEKDLMNVLRGDIDIEANRQRTLKHRWEYVVERILKVLDS